VNDSNPESPADCEGSYSAGTRRALKQVLAGLRPVVGRSDVEGDRPSPQATPRPSWRFVTQSIRYEQPPSLAAVRFSGPFGPPAPRNGALQFRRKRNCRLSPLSQFTVLADQHLRALASANDRRRR
jgi:hypothetical protein